MKRDLHKKVIGDGSPVLGSLQEVVHPGLEAAVARVPFMGPVVEWLPKQGHPWSSVAG